MKNLNINIAKEVSNLVMTRDSIKLVFDKINHYFTNKQAIQVSLDFKEVDFISRAAAHELCYNIKAFQNKQTNIVFKNMKEDLTEMIDVVKKSSSKPKTPFLIRHYVSNSKEFNSLLQF